MLENEEKLRTFFLSCPPGVESLHGYAPDCTQGRNRHIFLRGKVIFPDFFSRCEMLFPGRKFPFWYTQNKFPSFSKVKKRKKKKKKKKRRKKKRSSPLFRTFPTSISNFSPSPYNFPSFLLNFYPFPLFSLPIFSRYVSKNLPITSLGGGGHFAPCPPPPPPPPVTALTVHIIL